VRIELVEIAERALSTSIKSANSTKGSVSNRIAEGTVITDDDGDISRHEESLFGDLNESESVSDQNI
jgi:hypothetical protein